MGLFPPGFSFVGWMGTGASPHDDRGGRFCRCRDLCPWRFCLCPWRPRPRRPAGNTRAFANVPGSVEGVEGDEVARAFADAFGRSSSSFGGALSDVARSAADVTT